MVFEIKSVNPDTRVISVVFQTDDGEFTNNIHMHGPDAGSINLSDRSAVLGYLEEYGRANYKPKTADHPLVGFTKDVL
jgi:hypothetical protein